MGHGSGGQQSVKPGKALFKEVSAIDFSAKHHGGLKKQVSSGPPDKTAIEKFYKDLDSATSDPKEKSGLLRILPQYSHRFQPKMVSL